MVQCKTDVSPACLHWRSSSLIIWSNWSMVGVTSSTCYIWFLRSGNFRSHKSTGWIFSWHLRQMETFSTLLTLCEGNPLVTSGFPSQKPVTWSFDAFFDLCLNKRFSKQSRLIWFETPSRSLWRHCNVESHSYLTRVSLHWDWILT